MPRSALAIASRGLALGLLIALLLPALAAARKPVIAYVDQGDKLRLYDAELGAHVPAPDLTIPDNVGHRFAVSHDGRYVVWSDANRKIRLFDRAAGAEVALPNVDVFQNPGGLTVSDTGLIAFDDNSNGPARLYDSRQGSLVDTGLDANNGHRQTHLSGDGRFLATTCLDNCEVMSGGDADGYVQDLVTKQDTALPDDFSGAADRDEEHPCIDGDGSLVGFDITNPSDITNPTQRDVFLYDRSAGATLQLPGLNDPNVSDRDCVLDGPGTHVGLFNQDTGGFTLYDIAAKAVVPVAAPISFPAWFTQPFTPQPASSPPPGAGPSADTSAPLVSRVSLSSRRFRVGGRRSGTRFRYTLSEAARVQIAIERRTVGRRVGRRCRPDTRRLRNRRRCARYVRQGTLTADGRAGRNSTRLSGRVRCRDLRPGLHRAGITATDAAGNRSRTRSARFQVLPSGKAAQGPSLCLSPEEVRPGGSLTVTGRGWPRRARVALLIGPAGSETDRAATVRASRRGGFRRRLRIDPSAEPGRYALLACLRGCRVKETARFRIDSDPNGA